jgi:hypothetical protein
LVHQLRLLLVLVQRVLVLVLVLRGMVLVRVLGRRLVRRLCPVLKLRTLMRLPLQLIGADLRPMLVQWRGPMRPKRGVQRTSRPPVGCWSPCRRHAVRLVQMLWWLALVHVLGVLLRMWATR